MLNNPLNFIASVLIAISACICHQVTYASEIPNHRPALPSLAPILDQAMPAIVNVAVKGYMPAVPLRLPHGGIRQTKPRKFATIGSGVIINAEKGYVITNAHVIKDAKNITITLHDKRRLEAKTIGIDPSSDVAILQIKAKNLHMLPMGNSKNVRVGDFVVAIGNPFNLNVSGNNQSATFGVVSAVQRSDLRLEGMDNFIQTDAAINPGNSGGALINMKGELIGINTAIISPVGGNIGIGLAIPVNMVQEVATQIIKYGSVHRGLMGIFVQDLTPELATAFKVNKTKGALVAQVNPGSPAEKAGLKAGDILLSINGHSIVDASQIKNIIGLLRVDSKVNMKILRDSKTITLETVVVDVKKNEEQQEAKNPFLYGLIVEDFEQESPFHGHVKGVVVVGASESSAAYRSGLRPGDIINEINHHVVKTIKELNKFVKENQNDHILVHVFRHQAALYVVVK